MDKVKLRITGCKWDAARHFWLVKGFINPIILVQRMLNLSGFLDVLRRL